MSITPHEQAEVEQLRAEVAALRDDAERLRWWFGSNDAYKTLPTELVAIPDQMSLYQWRFTIDRARGKA